MTLNCFKAAILHVLRQYLLQLSFFGYTVIQIAKIQFEMLGKYLDYKSSKWSLEDFKFGKTSSLTFVKGERNKKWLG